MCHGVWRRLTERDCPRRGVGAAELTEVEEHRLRIGAAVTTFDLLPGQLAAMTK